MCRRRSYGAPISRRGGRRSDRTRGCCSSSRHRTRSPKCLISPRSGHSQGRIRHSWSSTIPSVAPPCSARSRWAPMSSCTRRPSTSTDRGVSLAARSWGPAPSSTSACCRFCAPPVPPCPLSMRGSFSRDWKRLVFAWRRNRRGRASWRSGWKAMRGSSGCFIPDSHRTPSTSSRAASRIRGAPSFHSWYGALERRRGALSMPPGSCRLPPILAIPRPPSRIRRVPRMDASPPRHGPRPASARVCSAWRWGWNRSRT